MDAGTVAVFCMLEPHLVTMWCCGCFSQIKGYPTLKVFHKGEEVKSYRGETLVSWPLTLPFVQQQPALANSFPASLRSMLEGFGYRGELLAFTFKVAAVLNISLRWSQTLHALCYVNQWAKPTLMSLAVDA